MVFEQEVPCWRATRGRWRSRSCGFRGVAKVGGVGEGVVLGVVVGSGVGVGYVCLWFCWYGSSRGFFVEDASGGISVEAVCGGWVGGDEEED